MLRRVYDRKVMREMAVLKAFSLAAGFVICAGVFGLYFWRLHHFEHAVARIECVWEVKSHRRGSLLATMAELTFVRKDAAGKSIPCRYAFEIGRPSDGFRAGDRLEVVPATGTCQHVDIIGRAPAK